MIQVDLQEFLRTGTFGPLRLGMSRAQVATRLGRTVAQFAAQEYRVSTAGALWRDGPFEFHFALNEDALVLIYSDHLKDLASGPAIDLDPWILAGGLARRAMCQALDTAQIAYYQVRRPLFDDGLTIITAGGVTLYFIETPHSSLAPVGLYNIAYAAPAHHGHPTGIPLDYELIGQIERFWDRAGIVGLRLLPDVHLHRGDKLAFHVAPDLRATSMQPEAFAFLQGFVGQLVEEVRVDPPAHDGRSGRSFATCTTPLTKQQARPGVAVYRIAAPPVS